MYRQYLMTGEDIWETDYNKQSQSALKIKHFKSIFDAAEEREKKPAAQETLCLFGAARNWCNSTIWQSYEAAREMGV